jgi:PAS domain-containing protein
MSALRIARQKAPDVTFLFVSGTLGEDVAIEALKTGATDYVLKTRLNRLVPAITRALREAQEKTERARAETALRRSEAFLAEGQRISHTGTWSWNVASGKLTWSDEHYRIFEYGRRPTLRSKSAATTQSDDRSTRYHANASRGGRNGLRARFSRRMDRSSFR